MLDGATQILIPKTIFVGERVQLQYVFENPDLSLSNDGNFSFETAKILFSPYEKFLTLEDASLTHNGDAHTLYLTFYVWEEGVFEFSPFSIGPAEIFLEPLEVKSVVEETGADGVRPFMSPLLLPGTTWMIYLGAVFALVFLIGVVIVLKKINAINLFLEKLAVTFFYKRNARKTIKLLKKLGKCSLDDKEFCAKLQSIMRSFIENRFKSNFNTVATRDIPLFFENILGGIPSGERGEAIESLSLVFARLDFVRFGQNIASTLSATDGVLQATGGVLQSGEKEKLIENCFKIVEGFENDAV